MESLLDGKERPPQRTEAEMERPSARGTRLAVWWRRVKMRVRTPAIDFAMGRFPLLQAKEKLALCAYAIPWNAGDPLPDINKMADRACCTMEEFQQITSILKRDGLLGYVRELAGDTAVACAVTFHADGE